MAQDITIVNNRRLFQYLVNLFFIVSPNRLN
jgi:hypothetical protein